MVKERRAKDLPEQPARKRSVVLQTGSGDELVDYGCEIRPDGSMRFEATDEADHERLIEAIREAKKPPAWLTQAPSVPHATQASPPDMQSLAGAMETLGASLAQSLSNSAASSMPPAPARPRAIGKAADAWLKSIEADTLKKTLIIKAAAINGFAQHVGVKTMLHDVQREDVHAWVEALRASGLQTLRFAPFHGWPRVRTGPSAGMCVSLSELSLGMPATFSCRPLQIGASSLR